MDERFKVQQVDNEEQMNEQEKEKENRKVFRATSPPVRKTPAVLLSPPSPTKPAWLGSRRASAPDRKTGPTTLTPEAAIQEEDAANSPNLRRASAITIAPDAVEADERKKQGLASKKTSTASKKSSFSALMPSKPLKYYLTKEVIPHVDHYRNRLSFSKGAENDRIRPSLDELMNAKTVYPTYNERFGNDPENDNGDQDVSQQGKVVKFGWVDGVYMRCLLNIWGVMLFLRLTWVIGQAGIIQGLSVITLSNVVTLITAISMSAVSTNGQIKGGGIYYMISRSLGPEFGGAIGITFTLANSIAVSMYIIGFCESLLDMLAQTIPSFAGIVDSTDRLNDIRLIGSVSLVLILALAIVGMEWVTRVQIGLLFLLIIAQIDFIIGTFLPPSDEAKAKGFVGYSGSVFLDNLWSDYSQGEHPESFFTVFAVFFPAVTGIVAGANLSGDLKNPGVAIPKGTLLAIATTYVSYIIYGLMIGACTLNEASGVPEEVHFGTDLFNETVGEMLNITRAFNDCEDRECLYGTSISQQMMEILSAWGPLIYAGCFAATISSAIASLVGAPRVFQAVAKDKLFPYISSFGEGWGANNDPVRGYILVFIISLICILIGDLNMVSSLLSNFFVAAYALINFSVFHASITNSPGWRPSFKYYNKWVSLFGTVLCIVVMFLMDYLTALVTFICIIALYLYVHVRKPDVNWGSSSQSQSFMMALKAVQSLSKVDDHVKNYRPKLLVMSGKPADRPSLMDFANLLTKRLSLLECTHIVNSDLDYKEMSRMKEESTKWLTENHIKGFLNITRNDNFGEGIRTSIELSGLGKLSPNLLLIGFNNKWKSSPERALQYLEGLQSALDLHLAVGVLRVQVGLDIVDIFGQNDDHIQDSIKRERTSSESSDSSDKENQKDSSALKIDEIKSVDEVETEDRKEGKGLLELLKMHHMNKNNNNNGNKVNGKKMSLARVLSLPSTDHIGNPIDDSVIEQIIQFRHKIPKDGTIDVYWLFDDGGLTLLLPHILSTRAKFANCKLRVFFLSDKPNEIDSETRNMAMLLAKFRIPCQDVILLTDVTEKASPETRKEFLEMTTKAGIPEKDLEENADKTNFHLRIAEILRQNSTQSTAFIAMTLPLMRKLGSSKFRIPPLLYMAWLDFLTKEMPPFLLIRGNQESVLTFYS